MEVEGMITTLKVLGILLISAWFLYMCWKDID